MSLEDFQAAADRDLINLRKLQAIVLQEIERAPPEHRAELAMKMITLMAQAHCTAAAMLPLRILTLG